MPLFPSSVTDWLINDTQTFLTNQHLVLEMGLNDAETITNQSFFKGVKSHLLH